MANKRWRAGYRSRSPRQQHRLWTEPLDFKKAHPPRDAPRFGFIAHAGDNPPLFAGDNEFALELRITGLLARRKKRVTINMYDGPWKGVQHQWRLSHLSISAQRQ
jgi:hypothetical protein